MATMADEVRKPDQLAHSVLAKIAEHRPVHVVDLAERLDEHPIAIDQACARLQKTDHVRPVAGGRYTLTDEGRQQLGESPE